MNTPPEKQMLDVRDCPECGAAKGNACRKISCPQLQPAKPIQPTPAPQKITPAIPQGSRRPYWCRTLETGAVHQRNRLLYYCNGYVMPLSDTCDDPPDGAVPVGDDGDYAWTGWLEESCEQCETHWMFHGDILSYVELPATEAEFAFVNTPSTPTQSQQPPLAEWRYTTHDSEIFLEFKTKGGPWVQAGIFFPQPGFTLADFMQMVGQIRHFPSSPPLSPGSGEAMRAIVFSTLSEVERMEEQATEAFHGPDAEPTASQRVLASLRGMLEHRLAQPATPPLPSGEELKTGFLDTGEPRIGGHHLCNRGHGWVVNGQPCYLCQHANIEAHVAEKTRFLNEREEFRRKLKAAVVVLEEIKAEISRSDDFSADEVLERIENGIAAAKSAPPLPSIGDGKDGGLRRALERVDEILAEMPDAPNSSAHTERGKWRLYTDARNIIRTALQADAGREEK